ncbi:MAG: PhzF family phenazine biosynthesis protein, partial [Pseudomonadales bacterium]|nr:PhzF family phenazine biosynthesis protein [Pseudomonadales bacterium]
VARSIGLDRDDIARDYPCEFVSTGLEFLIVPVRSLEALRRIRMTGNEFGRGLYAFCEQGYDSTQDLAARMFARSLGVFEDAATGSAAGCLAGYLSKHGLGVAADGHVRASLAQGYEVGRPSALYLDACRTGEAFEIRVGGRVRFVAEGEWLL